MFSCIWTNVRNKKNVEICFVFIWNEWITKNLALFSSHKNAWLWLFQNIWSPKLLSKLNHFCSFSPCTFITFCTINFEFWFSPVRLYSPVRLLILALASLLYVYSLPYVYSRPKSKNIWGSTEIKVFLLKKTVYWYVRINKMVENILTRNIAAIDDKSLSICQNIIKLFVKFSFLVWRMKFFLRQLWCPLKKR